MDKLSKEKNESFFDSLLGDELNEICYISTTRIAANFDTGEGAENTYDLCLCMINPANQRRGSLANVTGLEKSCVVFTPMCHPTSRIGDNRRKVLPADCCSR